MNHKPYVLNNTFWVYPKLGLIKQKNPAKETTIEPRLMNLLCLLIFYNGEMVGPGLLAKKVWGDYDSSVEHVTRAISRLREVLADHDNKIIEAVPRQGYVMHARITDQEIDENEAFSNLKKLWLAVATVLVLVIAAYFIWGN